MANRYPKIVGSRKISDDYDTINEMIDMVEEDVDALHSGVNKADTDIANHKSSTQAHSAAAITYTGDVIGATTAKQAIDNIQEQVNTLVVNGDSSPAAAQAAIDANGYDYKNLKLRLDTEHGQLASQLADTEHQLNNKADKAEVNALATEKANQVDLQDTNAVVSSLSTGKVDKGGVGQVTWAMASQDFREQVTGGNTAVVGPDSVSTVNIVNESVNKPKLAQDVIELLVGNVSNLITNGDFSSGSTGWASTSATLTVGAGEAQMLANAANGRVYFEIPYADTDIIYRSVLVKATSSSVALGAGMNRWVSHSGSGAYERLSDARVWATNKFLTVIDGRSSGYNPVYIKNAVAINLTEVFGAGKEPSKDEMDAFLDQYNGFIKSKVDIWDYSRKTKQGSMLVKISNLVLDGDFTGSGIEWTAQFATLSKTNNELTITGNGGNTLPRAILNTRYNVQTGHKIYASVLVESTNDDCDLIIAESYVSGALSGQYARLSNPQKNMVNHISGVITANGSGVMDFRVLHRYVDAATANDKAIKIKKVVLIDLTATFGVGYEPSKADMDILVKSQSYYIQQSTVADPGRVAANVAHVNRQINGYYNPTLKDAYDGTSVYRIDAETITVETLYKLWDGLIANNPTSFSKSILGHDASNSFDIMRVSRIPLKPKHKVLLLANIHGNSEDGDPKDASIALYEFMRDIELNYQGDPVLTYLRYNVAFDIIPCANPWGYDNNQRTNVNAVDLNRDFATSTPQAETVIIKNWLDANKDSALFMDIHAYGRGRTDYRLVCYRNNLEALENDVMQEVGNYVQEKRGYTFATANSSSSMAIYYAKYTLGIPSLLPEFPVYAAGRVTHGELMTTQYTEWIGNLAYRLVSQQIVTVDRLIMRTKNGLKRFMLTIDDNGDFTAVEV